MMRYSPIIVGVLLIVGLTIAQGVMSDRLAESNVTAEQQAELLKLVPKSFGDWNGEDKPVDPEVIAKAGAVGVAVSRGYRNARTGERVDLWLIVGHARDISLHTPDICFPGAGFEARGKENGLYPLEVDGKEASFWTNTFYKEDVSGRHLLRVFWTWFKPEEKKNPNEDQGRVVWQAPQNARWVFGNTRALYKMYFTSELRDSMETPEQSACVHFARDFLPEVEKALTAVGRAPESATVAVPTPSAGETTTSEAKSGAAAPAENAGAAGVTPGAEGQSDSPPPSNDGK